MTRQGEELNVERLQGLFQELSERLAERGTEAQVLLVGGAAMALAHDSQRLTRDVDGLFEPTLQVREIAADIADGHGLEPDWLNDGAKGYMPALDETGTTVYESESLLVQVPSPEFLLAMKMLSGRDNRDINDAAILFNKVGYTTPEQGLSLLGRSYPPSMLTARHRYIPAQVAERAAELRAVPKLDSTRERFAERIKGQVAEARKNLPEPGERDTPTRGPKL